MRNAKTKKRAISLWISLAALLVTAAMLVPFGMAWLADGTINSAEFEASVQGSYFERGDGSAEHPFVVARPIQLYYLAWLQDLGFFNEVTDGTISQFYFEIGPMNGATEPYPTELDMTGYVIPSIGTEQYPFVGNFNGNDFVISNLTFSESNAVSLLATSMVPL